MKEAHSPGRVGPNPNMGLHSTPSEDNQRRPGPNGARPGAPAPLVAVLPPPFLGRFAEAATSIQCAGFIAPTPAEPPNRLT